MELHENAYHAPKLSDCANCEIREDAGGRDAAERDEFGSDQRASNRQPKAPAGRVRQSARQSANTIA